MSEQTDFSALQWVKGEISESLKQAQHALEAFVANPKDSTKMQFCITHLHQVWGTLQMVELEGATLFALEMEALAQAIADEKVPKVSEAQEVLMQAFLQLPTYLENLASGSKDMPVVLLPVLNDLRSTRGEHLMSETAMFSPDLVSGNKVADQREDSPVSDLEDQLQKLRQAYQKSLLAVIQGETLEKNLDYMGKVLARLQKLSGKSQISQIWWIGGALIDGLLGSSINFSRSVNSLLGAIDRQIKEMVDDHKKVMTSPVPDELAKNLLYYVAGSEPTTKRIANVQKAYKLSVALPQEVREEQSHQARRSLVNDAIIAAVNVLIEDLLNINEVLDLVVRNKGKEDARMVDLLPVVKSIAGALHVLALKDSRDIMAAQYKILRACVEGKVPDIKSELMGVAGQLLAVESSLNDIAKNGLTGQILIGEISNNNKVSSDQLGVAQKVLLNEAIVSLEMVKELFAALFASGWEHNVLEEASAILKGISGSLKIIPLPLASEILDKSVLYINEKLLSLTKAPEQKELETFADVLSSVDYFLERLRSNSRAEDSSLNIGCERLATLGYGFDNRDDLKIAAPTIVEAKEEEIVLSEILSDEGVPAESEQPSASETANEQAITESITNEAEVIEQAAEAVPATTSSQVDSDDDNIIDAEIIEIFIEEVGEVQETLNEFLPLWMENIQDEASRTEVRRAFHTLKGSGRMVGATKLGEMAWAVENMLNRVIDNTISASEAVMQTVVDAVSEVPALLDIFKQAKNEATPRSTDIATRADNLANGQAADAPAPIASAEDTLVEESLAALEEVEQEEDIEVEAAPLVEYDMEIVEIFSQEALGHTASLAEFVAECREKMGPWILSDDFLRVMHTLKGCANMAAIEPVAPVVTKAENFVKELRLQDKKANEDVLALIETVITLTNQVIAEIPQVGQKSYELASTTLENIKHLSDNLLFGEGDQSVEGDSGKQERIDRFLRFAFDTIFDGEDYLNDYLVAQANTETKQANDANLEAVAKECIDVSRLAYECALDDVAELCQVIAHSLEAAQQQLISEEYCQDLAHAVARLTEIVDFLAAGQFIKSPEKISAKIQSHLDALPVSVSEMPVANSEQYVEQQETEQEDSEQQDSEQDETLSFDNVPLPGAETEFEFASTQEDVSSTLADSQDLPPLAEFSEETFVEQEDAEEQEEAIPLASVTEDTVSEDQQEPVSDIETSFEKRIDDVERDQEIVGIFLEEAEEIIENSANLLEQWQDNPSDRVVVAELQRDLHTLKGGARMAEFSSVGNLGHELENIYEALANGQLTQSSELFNLLFRCHDRISEMLSDIQSQGSCYHADDLLFEINQLVGTGGQTALDRQALNKNELTDVTQAAEETATLSFDEEHVTEQAEQDFNLGVDIEEPLVEQPIAEQQDVPLQLADEDDVSELEEITSEVASKLLDAGDDSELDVDLELVEIFLEEASEIIESSSSALEEWRRNTDNQGLVEQLQRELHTLKGGARMAQIAEIGDFAHEMENIYEGIVLGTVPKADVLINLLLICHDRLNEMVSSLVASKTCEAADDLVERLKRALVGQFDDITAVEKSSKKTSAIVLENNIDSEVIALFLNDGLAMINELESTLIQLKTSQSKTDIAKAKEILSGLNGGAKLSGFVSLGNYCSAFEKVIAEQGSKNADQDALMAGFKQIKDFVELLSKEQTKTKPATTVKSPTAPEKKPGPDKKQEAAKPKDDQAESIKISANLLESLVNLAGETSINRGRLEVQINDFAFTIEEMTGTIERLQEQLRRLHLETEAQIVFRHETETKDDETTEQDEDFDPLEMDRYSAIDQLSRSLSESASDLMDLKETLAFKTRDAETLLIQQGRINTELQEGLMRSRMVPFSRLVPRLRRIVRQVGNELKKPVDLDILNAEGELDRTVLERMISPIEHMLRNSIAHGIEKAADRKAANKPSNGTISIDLGREGSNMLIIIKDDGAGVNVAAVKKKAIENGLLDPNANLSDDEIVEFIFNPGFSTATEVSQVAGRGVGMDVVASEIRALKGSIETRSITGQGTTFTIRLPFTVAVNRALMVSISEALYAIPLTSIEGVVRISPYELEAYYEEENPIFNYAGVDYSLQYLGAYMNNHEKPHLLGQTRPLPVLLVQSGDHAVAMHVDALLGSREIVVKSVGPQLSTVAGISGATILGDGSVVIILDIHSMIRGALAQKESSEVQAGVIDARKEKRTTKVMVVDDSVTVRKVTSRLLERNGMEVVLAKDGVDAITQLQEIKPDVMLLDIEMPRMDGFEVATLVRHDDRLKDLPIIMITSRTGEKHKQRAMEIGVNRYMGKPFQENELLATIDQLLSEIAANA